MSTELPSHARVVVIGGGVVGCSIAYHLAALGCTDVVLLERSKLGSGTTWHAAGNMETYRADPLISDMIAYSVGLYPKLEAETGQALGWRQTGRVFFTTEKRRMEIFRGLKPLGQVRGIELEPMTPAEVAAKLPVVSAKGLEGGLWVPGDGRINPTDLATAMARGARLRSARVFEDTPATGFATRNGRIHAVLTKHGEIICEHAVIAAGMWSSDLGTLAGVHIPLHAVQHHYLLTKPIDVITRDMPMFLSYDEKCYGREDVGGLLLGFFDINAIPVSPAELPDDFSFGLFDVNWEQIEPNMEAALERFPVMQTAEVRTVINGPESFTPDMQMVLGEAPAVGGLFVAAGMNSSGIALSGAVGRLTAEWIMDGRPSMDVTKLDIRRFGEAQAGRPYLRQRASEVVTHMCRFPEPELDFDNTRQIRLSPLHEAMAAQGAQFTTVQSWECPIWFGKGEPGAVAVAEEVQAAETAVALFDRSSDCVLHLEGPAAEQTLRHLSGAPRVAVGEARLAPFLNRFGGLEALPVVVGLKENGYLLFTEAEQSTRLKAWVERHRPDGTVALVDVTSGWACLRLVGPHAAALVAAAAEGYDPEGPSLQPIQLGFAPAHALTVAGLTGVFLLMHTEFAVCAYRAIIDKGEHFGLRHAGSLAAATLATRNGMPRFGIDVTPFTDLGSTGLMDLLEPEHNRVFLGRDAVLTHNQERALRRSFVFRLPGYRGDGLLHAPLLADGARVGHVTSVAAGGDGGDDTVLMALIEAPVAAGTELAVLAGGVARPLFPLPSRA
ncbi:FAD-dependent oxidoreductase [Rhodoligotrophos defluvii]|uniref:FAD-dependent oxidoreductase n=1 Tax=Rhodoligotrophos defluvii TaxID=2561934 RepID=UPI0010C9A45E|nr:FAD-dependent oxidoreductase [Rhodoligotrophos defluvii]